MNIQLTINSEVKTFEVSPKDRLLDVLRRNGYFGVKHGCDDSACGACAVLIDGVPVNSCTLLAAQVEGKSITTIEGLGVTFDKPDEGPTHGWTGNVPLHPLQRAFVETGAIQCGYCTPAMILAAKSLLDRNPNPSEAEVREALSGVLCRCTGYAKPVQAVLRAAALMRGEEVEPIELRGEPVPVFKDQTPPPAPEAGEEGTLVKTTPLPTLVFAPETNHWKVVGKPEVKVDAYKLVQGKPAFADDIELRGMLIAKVLHSPIAHARIKRIDASKARELPGVADCGTPTSRRELWVCRHATGVGTTFLLVCRGAPRAQRAVARYAERAAARPVAVALERGDRRVRTAVYQQPSA